MVDLMPLFNNSGKYLKVIKTNIHYTKHLQITNHDTHNVKQAINGP